MPADFVDPASAQGNGNRMLTVRTTRHNHLGTSLGQIGQRRHDASQEAKNSPVNLAQH
jgi:hypothetical protein